MLSLGGDVCMFHANSLARVMRVNFQSYYAITTAAFSPSREARRSGVQSRVHLLLLSVQRELVS